MYVCIYIYTYRCIYRYRYKCIYENKDIKKVFFVKTDCPSFNGRKAAPERKLSLACFAEGRLLFFFLCCVFSFVQLGSKYFCRFCTCVQLLYSCVWWKHLFKPFSLNSFFVFVYLTLQGDVDFFYLFFFLIRCCSSSWQERRWMDRNTHQDNGDSESDYDVVENLEARNLHMPARPMHQDNGYAGRFFIYISAFLCFSSVIFTSFWNHLVICQWLKPISVTIWPFSSHHFFADREEKNIHAWTEIKAGWSISWVSSQIILLVKCKKEEKHRSFTSRGGNKSNSVDVWGERSHAEWARTAGGPPGPSVGCLPLWEHTIIKEPIGGKVRGRLSCEQSPLFPARMWPPARSFLCWTASAHLERSPSVFYTSIPAVMTRAHSWVFELSSKAILWRSCAYML